MANLGAIGALADQNAAIASDKLNHASLIDGCRLSGAEVRRYRTGDTGHAAELLSTLAAETRLVVDRRCVQHGRRNRAARRTRAPRASRRTPGCWSTMPTGSASSAPRARQLRALRTFGARCAVLIGTFGKAFGTFGAFVRAIADLIDLLMQKARYLHLHRPALPPAVAAATRAALRVSVRERWRREKAQACRSVRGGLLLKSTASARPGRQHTIVPVIIARPGAGALAVSRRIESAASRHGHSAADGTAGTARLRVTSRPRKKKRRSMRCDCAGRGVKARTFRSAPVLSRSTGAPSRAPSIVPATATTRAAGLQERVRNDLVMRLDDLRIAPGAILDLGAGTGHWIARAQAALSALAGGAAESRRCMLERARRQSRWLRRFARLRADAYSLPFRDAASTWCSAT
jgi:hypothetical protein